MVDGQVIAYNITSFICALFVLEFGADKFIDNTAVVAKRTGIPQGVIALLTAGAEWEELAVVVISIARHRSSLAIGNIVGSTISNILGAFSLGLLFHKKSDEKLFDKSSKLYSTLLLILTALIAGITGFGHRIVWRIVGGIAIGLFVIYVLSIAWTIYKGYVSAPELSDSESSDEEGDGEGFQERNSANEGAIIGNQREWSRAAEGGAPNSHSNASNGTIEQHPATSPEIANTETSQVTRNRRTPSSLVPIETNSTDSARRTTDHGLIYHIGLLFIGILAVILSAYVLSHAATTLIDQFGISDVLFGVVILSIATTIPEKFIAVISGFRGQLGIMVANTVGSNIFLLSLCMGILWVSTGGAYDEGSVNPAEIGVMLGSTVAMTLAVWFGAKWARPIGAAMFAAYIVFLALEFAVIHQV